LIPPYARGFPKRKRASLVNGVVAAQSLTARLMISTTLSGIGFLGWFHLP
jgi:hypothetical protein